MATEVTPVLKALRKNGLDVVAMRTGEVGGAPAFELAAELAVAGVEERPVEIEPGSSHR